jgi:phosphatidylglycerol:prolipoprotein diacylglycerol transferase
VIEINLDPNMFSLGPLLITWHGFFSAVGLGLGMWLTARLVQGTAMTADDIYSLALAAVPGGIVGARLLYVLENAYLFANNPLGVLALNEGGISIYGAVIGGTLAGAIYARMSHRPLGLVADRAMIGLMLGQGIGRFGDIINGEHHGQPAGDFPFSVVYTHPNTLAEYGIPVHLAVGYELVYDLAMAGLLYLLLKRQPRDGVTVWAYQFVYGFGRLWVGFFRKDTLVLGNLGMAQTLGVIGMVIAVPCLVWLWRSASPISRAQRRRA